jgi:hypothetical protein
MDWLTLLQNVGLGAALLGFAAWLCREIVLHAMDRDIERFKADLQRAAFEHQVRFSTLHEKQAEVVAETYARLVKVQEDIFAFVRPIEYDADPPREERREKVLEAFRALQGYLAPRQIYLPTSTRNKVKQVTDRLASVVNKRTESVQYGKGGVLGPPNRKEEATLWVQAFEEFRKEVPPLLTALEADFQRLLGVENANGTN